jgi:hypothetical protein
MTYNQQYYGCEDPPDDENCLDIDDNNMDKSLYDTYNEQYNTLYYSLYNDIIKLFKIYKDRTGNSFILISDITDDLLLHPGIYNIQLQGDTLILNAKNDFPNITQFISIKFMIRLIKFLEYNFIYNNNESQ